MFFEGCMKNRKRHTNEHASSQFAAHGSISIRREEFIIYYEIAGPFNLEVNKAFARTVAVLLNRWTLYSGLGRTLRDSI
jgi:hypothetical protein